MRQNTPSSKPPAAHRLAAVGSLTALLAMAGAASLGARAVDAPPPQRMTVPHAFEGIVADGLSNDVVWERGAITYGFLRADDGEPARHQSRARALYDRRNLYFAFTAEEPDVETAMTNARRGGDDWRTHDTVGVRLHVPLADGGERIIEVRVNPANRVWFLEDGRVCASLPAGLETGVFRRQRSWDTEVILPFAALGVEEPRVGDVWPVGFPRHRAARGDEPAESSDWNPPNGRGEIRFGRDLLVYLFSQRPFSGRDEVMVYNPSDSLRQLRAELIEAATGRVVAHETIYIGSGHRRQHFPLPAPEVGDYYILVRQTDRPLEGDDDKLVEWRPHRSGPAATDSFTRQRK